MAGKLLFVISFLLTAFNFNESFARIVDISNTEFSAPYVPRLLNSSSSSPSSSEDASADSSSDSGGGLLQGPGPGLSARDCRNDVNWVGCEYADNCVVYQADDVTYSEETCTCYQMPSPDNLTLCDGQLFKAYGRFNFDNYARALGYAWDFANNSRVPNDNYDPGENNYYYIFNWEGFCPYLLHVRLHDNPDIPARTGLTSIASNYYNNTETGMVCTSSSTGLALVGNSNTGLHCVRPGYNLLANEKTVNICVYNAAPFIIDNRYEHVVSEALPLCTRKADYINEARNVYALSGVSDDLSSRNILKDYYLYRPEYTDVNYTISECYINCSASSVPYDDDAVDRIRPLCQGWHYKWNCSALRDKYENDSNYSPYHISSVTSDPVTAGKNAQWVEYCDNSKYFAVCGLKSQRQSETQCNALNGTCIGAQGEADCGGDKYCTSCICSSEYLTLSEWCANNGISAASCDNNRYEGVHDADSTTDVCTLEGDAKYLDYQLKNTSATACPAENRTNALESSSLSAAYLIGKYGNGAVIEQCWDASDNSLKWHISCSSDLYSTMCHINSGSSVQWCVYGRNENVNMKAEAGSSNPIQYCQTLSTPGLCGQTINRLNSSGVSETAYASSTLKIYTVSSPQQCYNTYGKAATAQLCIYPAGANQDSGTHYNCYYDLAEFIYSTTNKNGAVACAVRHDLSGDYIIHQGQKRWSQCACPTVYSYNQYAGCSEGLLGGNPCVQDLSNVNNTPYLKAKWIEILGGDDSAALDANGNITISSITLYPYCICDPSYKYTCDGDRETGVGNSCQGKYKLCTCDTDPLPDNWTDDFFSCPDGYEPTGVWKDNGCGQKIWECSNAISCTSEYKYTCDGAGQKGVDGQGCQDSTGAYVRFKACECQSGYTHICTGSGQTGDGEACVINADDTPLYKSCSCPSGYSKCGTDNTIAASGASTCTVEPEEGSPYTAYSECSCPSSWTDCNSDGQEGDDSDSNYVCQYGGATYYKYCRCPSGLQDCSNPDDTSAYPAISGIAHPYVGVESFNYCKVPNIAYEKYKYEQCKCNTDIFTLCDGNGASGIGARCQTVNDESPLYSSCVCNSEYTSTCPESEGKEVDSALAYDYCQIGDADKLYKESSCVCNASGWTTCNGNGQVGVGRKCLIGDETATNLPKYTSCACEANYQYACSGAGQYGASVACTNSSGETYTCSGNAYEFPSDTSDVCVLNGTSYFTTTCNCASGYTHTCDGTGEVPAYPNDYCEINSTRYYTSCSCDSTYNYTCAAEDHLKPTDENDYCINTDGVRYYQACACASGYATTCTEQGFVPPTETSSVTSSWTYTDGYCELNGTKYYKSCKCASGLSTCNGSMSGTADTNQAVCIDHGSLDDNGNWLNSVGTKYYQACSCDSRYAQCGTALGGNASSYPITNTTDYCDEFSTSLNLVGGRWMAVDPLSTRKYGTCNCVNNNYVTTSTYTALQTGQTCTSPQIPDETSAHCVGWKSSQTYDAYASCTLDSSWYPCIAPARALGTSGQQITITGITYSQVGCECPPWFSSECSSMSATQDNESGNVMLAGNTVLFKPYNQVSWASSCVKNNGNGGYSLYKSSSNGTVGAYLGNSDWLSLSGSNYSGQQNIFHNIQYDVVITTGVTSKAGWGCNYGWYCRTAISNTGGTYYPLTYSGSSCIMGSSYSTNVTFSYSYNNQAHFAYFFNPTGATRELYCYTMIGVKSGLSNRVYSSSGYYYPSCTRYDTNNPAGVVMPQCIAYNLMSMNGLYSGGNKCAEEQYLKAKWNNLTGVTHWNGD